MTGLKSCPHKKGEEDRARESSWQLGAAVFACQLKASAWAIKRGIAALGIGLSLHHAEAGLQLLAHSSPLVCPARQASH